MRKLDEITCAQRATPRRRSTSAAMCCQIILSRFAEDSDVTSSSLLVYTYLWLFTIQYKFLFSYSVIGSTNRSERKANFAERDAAWPASSRRSQLHSRIRDRHLLADSVLLACYLRLSCRSLDWRFLTRPPLRLRRFPRAAPRARAASVDTLERRTVGVTAITPPSCPPLPSTPQPCSNPAVSSSKAAHPPALLRSPMPRRRLTIRSTSSPRPRHSPS